MKLGLSGFIFYLFLLTVFPCQDKNVLTNPCKTEQAAASHNDRDCCDHCSPFCVCSCCHLTVFSVHTGVFNMIETTISDVIVLFPENYSYRRVHSIWRPPLA